MHELAVCQALMMQLEQIAAGHDASTIERVVLSVGALSGVEPQLLERAFEIARAGTVAAAAELDIQTGAIRVRCNSCGSESAALANRLLCAACGEWRVKVIAGEELKLLSLEFSRAHPISPSQDLRAVQTPGSQAGQVCHVKE